MVTRKLLPGPVLEFNVAYHITQMIGDNHCRVYCEINLRTISIWLIINQSCNKWTHDCVRQVSLVSTTRRAKIVILVIVLIGFSLGSYPLFTIGVERSVHSGLLKCLIKVVHRRVVYGSILCDPPNPTQPISWLIQPNPTRYKWKDLDPTQYS